MVLLDGDVMGARELRDWASRAGVTRERGMTKAETAEAAVEQEPGASIKRVSNHPSDAYTESFYSSPFERQFAL